MTIFLKTFAQSISETIENIPGVYQPTDDLEHTITKFSLKMVLTATFLLIVFTLVAILASKKKWKALNTPLFFGMAFVMIVPTLVLMGSTIYLNTSSDSGGPVHWHADTEYWVCGNEMEVRDPVGFSNKVGTSTLHEHDDRRVHLEGVVVDSTVDASLGKFNHVIGGALTNSNLVLPLNPEGGQLFEELIDGDGPSDQYSDLINDYISTYDDGGRYLVVEDGQTCGDQVADVQVFVYKFNEADNTYEQTKVDDPVPFTITDNPNVPPGDCIVVEFDIPKEKTDKLCNQYGIRDIDRCQEFGVEPDQRAVCTNKQINYDRGLDYRLPSYDNGYNNDDGDSSIDALCDQFYDEYGTFIPIEIAVYKDDGKLLNPEKDCEEYKNRLIDEAQP